MKLEGCQVVIKCGGVSMREFSQEVDEDGNIISCYIASQPGKEFSIEYTRNLNYGPPDAELGVDVYFGDVFDGPGWIARDPSPRAKQVTGEIYGSRNGNKSYNYGFSMPELIDGETPSSVDPERIGEIQVRLGFIVDSERIEEPGQHLLTFGPAKVNEKDKKPGVHCAGPISKTSGKRCLGEVFFGHAEDPLSFVFLCRSDEWLQAKGIMRKRRRRGEAEPAEDLELSPPPKSEPVEEVAPGGDIVVGNEPADQGEGRTHPVLWPTEQEQKPTPVGAVTPLERPRKLPRHSERSTFASSMVTAAPKKDSPGPKVKVERDSLLPTVKAERDGLSSTVKVERDSLLPTVKVEEVSSVPKVKEEAAEVMVNEPKVLKGTNKISKPRKNRKVKTERE